MRPIMSMLIMATVFVQRESWCRHVVLRAQQAFFFRREGNKRHAPFQCGTLAAPETLASSSSTGRARSVVVGAVVNLLAPSLRQRTQFPQTDVIVVRADHDGFILESGIVSFQDANDIGRRGNHFAKLAVEGELNLGCKSRITGFFVLAISFLRASRSSPDRLKTSRALGRLMASAAIPESANSAS